jgi:AI-2 transport protein TqsA
LTAIPFTGNNLCANISLQQQGREMPTKFFTYALAFAFVALLFFVLISGRDILIPLAIAIMLWYLLNALTRAFQRIPLGRGHLPRSIALTLAIVSFVLLISLLVEIITGNMTAAATAAPIYQAHLESLLMKIAHAAGWRHAPNFAQLEKTIDVKEFLTGVVTVTTHIASNTGIIIVYVAFLFVEQMSFNLKIAALFKDPKREQSVRSMLHRMEREIETYVLIKTVISLLVGGLSYVILTVAGVDYAAFWGFLIFLLNFIPTLGALLAIAFPSLLTLVQFDNIYIFVGVAISLGIVHFLVSNVLEPKVMGKSLNLSPLVIILSLVLWGSIWGIAGMFLSVPITVIIGIVCSLIPQARPVAILLSSDGQINSKS